MFKLHHFLAQKNRILKYLSEWCKVLPFYLCSCMKSVFKLVTTCRVRKFSDKSCGILSIGCWNKPNNTDDSSLHLRSECLDKWGRH